MTNPNTQNMKSLAGMIAAGVVLLTATAGLAQSAYFHAVSSLNPVAYWTMHEAEPSAPGDIETNYGTLGVLGTGYYPDWMGGGSAIQHQVAGALAGDTDTAVYFGTYNGNTFTNELFIPHTVPACTLNPPFSVECWFNTTNASANGNDIWSQMGNVGLNGGVYNAGGKTAGIRFFVGSGGYTLYTYDPGKDNLLSSTMSAASPVWCHMVVTCDINTNFAVYINGVLSKSGSGVGKYTPDFWTPFEVGNGLGNTRAMDGNVDELAIYPTNLSVDAIMADYQAGTNPAPATPYYQVVQNNNPSIYLRMDAPAYTTPPAATWPVLANFGSVIGNGVYSPGTMPGTVPGPANPAGVPFSGFSEPVATNVALFSGVSSYADAGYDATYNPTGRAPFTVTAIFRGNPCDGRFQDIVGHSDNSWRIAMNTDGALQCSFGQDPANVVNSAGIYNDGNWHQVVDVYQPASNPNVTGTNTLYVDGVVDTIVTGTSTNGIYPGTNLDVFIAAAPDYTNNPAGVGRQFAGQVCDVALFTNALTQAQVRTLYDAAGEAVAPYIIQQPQPTVSGHTTMIDVTANGTDPLAYQWYFNTTPGYAGALAETDGNGVSGSTSANLTITNLSEYYFVVVTNVYGAVTSSVVTPSFAPIIVAQTPATYTNLYTLYPGFNHSFSVSVLGAGLSYQWYTNGVAVAGATNDSFSAAGVVSSFTNYCIITNSFGTATSSWAAAVISLPAAPYPQSVLALGPIDYWRFNEPDQSGGNGPDNGVVSLDYIGGNDGLYTNVNLSNPGYNQTSDPSDTSVLFGNNQTPSDVYAIGTNVDFSTPSGNNAEFSIEAWVNLQFDSSGGLVTKGNGGTEEASLDMGGQGDAFRFLVRNAAGVTNVASSTIVPNLGSWYHVVGVCDQAGGVVSLYVNGILAGSTNIPSGGGIYNNVTGPMTFGARAATQTSGDSLQTYGYMNDVAIFNYALSPGQIAGEYDAGGGTIAAYFAPPPTNTFAVSNATLTIPAAVIGTPPMGYDWINVTTSTTIAAGTTNGTTLDATLNYPSLPASWNGDQLELIATNAIGSTNVILTLTVGGYPQSNVEMWNAASGGFTNTLDWLPRILTPSNTTNWPDDFNGNGFDYVAVLTNNTGHIACLYTNTDINGTNLIGQLAIGGYGAGLGGGDISNAFIMNGGQLTVTDFTASASAGYAFTVGGTTPNPVSSTNYFIQNGGTFNSTNSSGGNNWIGYASNTVNTVDINGGIMNLDGLFLGGCGLNTFNINGGTVNFVPPPGGGGSAGVLNMGWDTNGDSTLNLISGLLNVNCTNNAPSINLGANRNGPTGFFTFNMSGGTLNAYQIGVGASSGTGASQAQSTGPETNIVNFSGGVINLGAGGITNTIADQHDTNLFIMSGGTFSTLSLANYTPGTTTGNWTMWRGVNAVYILTNQPGPGTVNFAPLSGANITLSAQLTGNGNLNASGPGTVIMTNANTYTGNTIVSGGALALIGHGSIISTNIIVAGGATLDVSKLSTTFVLGSSQTLSNSSSTALIDGSATSDSGTLSLDYSPGTASFDVTNGTFTLSATTVLNINNTGPALGMGTYTLIGVNTSGTVAGTLPSSFVVTGGGVQGAYRPTLTISSSNTLDLIVGPAVNSSPTNISFGVTNNQLYLTWPSDHIGWTLQAQTNRLSVGINTNWVNVARSTTTNQIVVPINLSNGCVFYRLTYP
ncbi:MAG TPA: LamG-like jellyroll fold domain-containing protein [Alphaproteobacteria bacterium]|nr:LamG-like jellyroll fold domain-containing protein [Alphaproteobacteria bacterium]